MCCSGRSAIVCVVLLAIMIMYCFQDPFQPESVRGKRVVITGASAGIGEELAYQYSKLGANVLITARREHVLQKVVAKCKELGAQSAYYIALDMSKSDDHKQLIEEAGSKLHGLDQLILNHVSYDHFGLWDGDVERLDRVMKLNFESYVSLASLAIPLLEKSSGSIGVVSSGAGKIATPFGIPYCSAKFALGGFFSSLRQEFILTKRNISITLCILGPIATQNTHTGDKYYKGKMDRANVTDTAYNIMSGVTSRQREVFYPWPALKLISLLRDWFPEGIEYLTRQLVNEEALESGT